MVRQSGRTLAECRTVLEGWLSHARMWTRVPKSNNFKKKGLPPAVLLHAFALGEQKGREAMAVEMAQSLRAPL